MHQHECLTLARRGFLSGLASLPLIGGSVALIGNPTGVAAKYDPFEASAYLEWLDTERNLLMRELYGEHRIVPANTGAHLYHFPSGGSQAPAASTRAALVLATVGCDWRRGALI